MMLVLVSVCGALSVSHLCIPHTLTRHTGFVASNWKSAERRTVKMFIQTNYINHNSTVRSQVNSNNGYTGGREKNNTRLTGCTDCDIAHAHTTARPTWDSPVHPSPPPRHIPCKLAAGKGPFLHPSLFLPTLHVRHTQSPSMTTPS